MNDNTNAIDSLMMLPPKDAADAARRLDLLTANKKWGAKLTSGDVAANAQFAELTKMIAEADRVDAAIKGENIRPQSWVMEQTVDGELPSRAITATVASMRDVGID